MALVNASAQVQLDTRAHVEQLVPNIEAVLESNHIEASALDTIVVGVGPAPFTGLRAGIVAARALAFAHHTPLLGQDVLEPQALWLADQLEQRTQDFALIVNDARRKQLYWRLYDISAAHEATDNSSISLPLPISDIDISKPETILSQAVAMLHEYQRSHGSDANSRLHIMGQGVERYRESLLQEQSTVTLGQVIEESLFTVNPQVAAQYMYDTANAHLQQGDAVSTEPLYVRRPDVSVPNPLKHVLGQGSVQHRE